MGAIVGIDFGTANYRIATMVGTSPTPIYDKDGQTVFPSVIACTKGKQWLVGLEALQQASENLDCTFFSIKNLLGTKQVIEVQGIEMKPTEIISHLFEKIKKDIKHWFSYPANEVVISYPSTFSEKMIDELRVSAELAFFTVGRMITETDAIALYYSYTYDPNNENIMVFDIGAGSCTVGTYEMDDGVVEAKAIDGNLAVNGNVLSKLIFDYCLREFERVNGAPCNLDHAAYMRLYHMAELAKILLSDVELYRLYISAIMKDSYRKVYDMDLILSRDLLDNLLDTALVKQIELLLKNNVKDAYCQIEDISKIMVSGSVTRMPLIRQIIQEFIGTKKIFVLPPYSCGIRRGYYGGDYDRRSKRSVAFKLHKQRIRSADRYRGNNGSYSKRYNNTF